MAVLRAGALLWSASAHRSLLLRSRRSPGRRALTCLGSASGLPHRSLTIIHFTDVYNIDARTIEPVGGAARFTSLVNGYAQDKPLVLFSGDCLNPSLLSAFTKGEQMVPILNGIGVRAAVAGNHDFDFGVGVLQQHMTNFAFPWLLSNVLDATTMQPLGGAQRSVIIPWEGVNVGLLGLVERDWLLTIPSIEADKDIVFLDYVEEGRRLAHHLRQAGADIVVALTHMRAPNDAALAAAVPEIQLILGGHDHDYQVHCTEPHGTMLFKSGTDFREFSLIKLQVPMPSSTATITSSASSSTTTSRSEQGNGSVPSSNGSAAPHAAPQSAVAPRPPIEWEHVQVVASVPEHPETAATVARYQSLVDTRMDQRLGRTFVALDARFDSLRTRESNVGNLLGDIMRLGLNAAAGGVDAAFFNGGTVRSDQVHAAGRLSMRDFVTMLPFTDELVVLELSGAALLTVLETGVSSWPMREGRFLQVSGMSFAFDPSQPPGSRIVPGSVEVRDAPLDHDRPYRVATKAYLRSGKDGFESLRHARVVVDGETAPRLATLVHYLLTRVEELNTAHGANTEDEEARHQQDPHASSSRSSGSGSERGVATAAAPAAAAAGTVGKRRSLAAKQAVAEATRCPAPCANGLDALYFFEGGSGQWGIAPVVEGRIRNVADEPAQGA